MNVRHLAVLPAALLAAGAAPPAAAQAALAPQDSIAWSEFRWGAGTIGGRTYPHAAILVPVTSEELGGTWWLQLDTGADAGLWIYRNPLTQLLARRGVAYDSARAVRVSGRIGGYPLRDEPVQVRRFRGDTIHTNDPAPKIGTLGLSFLAHRTLLLDLPRNRFALLDSAAALPPEVARRVSWVPATLRNGKLFIPLTLNGHQYDAFFYDTGASMFALSTTPEVWRRITGRNGMELENAVMRVPSFGDTVVLKGAPVEGRATIGPAAVSRPVAYYVAAGPDRLDFRTWSFRVDGLVGNAFFGDRYLIVLDLPRGRFGLVPTAALR